MFLTNNDSLKKKVHSTNVTEVNAKKNRNPWLHTTMVMLLMLWASMNRMIFCGQIGD